MYYLLGTFGDGQYWRSGIEVLLYPTGCSFYRPFSYRKEWVGDEVLCSKSEESEGVVGYRFLDKSKNELFVPLRHVKQVVVGGRGEYHVRFMLGNFILHGATFTEFNLTALKAGLPGFNDDKLLLAVKDVATAERFKKLPNSAELPANSWELMGKHGLIGNAKIAPAEFRTTFLRLLEVRDADSGELVLPATAKGGPLASVSGYSLTARRVYELDVEFRTLMEPEQKEAHVDMRYCAQVEEAHMAVSRPVLARTGNYREETLWVSPKVAEAAARLLEWLPEQETRGSEGAPTPLALRIPYRVEKPSRFKFRYCVFWSGAGSILAAIVLFGFAACATGALGAPKNDGLATVLSAVGAALLPLGIGILAYWFQQWQSMDR